MRRALVVLMACGCSVGPLVAPQELVPPPDAGDDATAAVEPDAAPDQAAADATVVPLPPDAGRDQAGTLARDVASPLAPDAPADVAPDLAPDLTPDTSPCQPSECVAGGPLGLVLPGAARCPAGLGLLLGSGLSAPACTGCTCARAPAVCRGTLYAWPTDYIFNEYPHYEECQAAPAGTGGVGVEIATGQPCDTVFAPLLDFESPTGFRMGPLSLQLGACTPRGRAAPPPAAFQDHLWFCPVPPRPAGCAEGSHCLRAAGRLCLLLEGGATCPAGTVQRGGDWWEGIDDQRQCGACTCGSPAGGSCEGVHAQIGNDIVCHRSNQIELDPGEKVCLRGLNAPYAPGVMLAGEPTRGTCTPATETMGAARAKGRHTLCCAP